MCCLNLIDLRGRRLVLRTLELKRAEATLQVDITFQRRSWTSEDTCPPLLTTPRLRTRRLRRDLPPRSSAGRGKFFGLLLRAVDAECRPTSTTK
jgi:hypothetical protein